MDVFGYEDTWGGGIKSPDSAGFVFNDLPVSLVQGWNVQYQQAVQPIFECGSSKVYFSAKHASGTCTIDRIVSDAAMSEFVGTPDTGESFMSRAYGSVCSPGEATIVATEGCAGSQATVELLMKNTVLTAVGYSGQAQNSYVSENIQLMFSSLEE